MEWAATNEWNFREFLFLRLRPSRCIIGKAVPATSPRSGRSCSGSPAGPLAVGPRLKGHILRKLPVLCFSCNVVFPLRGVARG